MMKTLSSMIKGSVDGKEPQLSYSDLLKKRADDNKRFNDELVRLKGKSVLEALIGRSGIMPLHQKCTVNNYEAVTPGQKEVKQFAYYYLVDFHKNQGQGFIFGGTPGTGKNHLASAICNKLIRDGKKCAVITVNELMIKSRKCYGKNPKFTEDEFISNLVGLDLLVLDEVGVQKRSDNEIIMISTIIDQRIGNLKPTGMLTNLEANEIDSLLGEPLMDRMRMNGGKWLPFKWSSYRK